MIVIIGLSVILTIIGLIKSLIRNRFYLVNLKADRFSIEIEYFNYNNIFSFNSNIQDIEFIKGRTFDKFPEPILIIKNKGSQIVKIYPNINDGLTKDKLEILIENLINLKIANH